MEAGKGACVRRKLGEGLRSARNLGASTRAQAKPGGEVSSFFGLARGREPLRDGNRSFQDKIMAYE